jgi:tetratricopeptide (TPR) repeat protein
VAKPDSDAVNRIRLAAMAAVFTALTALHANNSHAKSPFQAARHFIEKGQYTEARRALKSELYMHPENIEARYNLAVLLEDIAHPAQAIELYEKNLAYAWHLPSVINLAAILQRQGKQEEARLWLQKATKNLRYEATPWYLLAAMAERDCEAEKAEALYKKALKADPMNGFAYLHYGEFQSRREISDKGLKYAARATHLLPNCAPCWRRHGDILRAVGKNRLAVEAFQRSLAIQPNNKTRQHLINALHSLGRHERADRMQKALDTLRKHRIGK